ncbi:hypothetical protein [Ekhidna sp.]
METTTHIRVLWYNSSSSSYQFGTWNDFNQLISNARNPQEIHPLERFSDASDITLKKIANELNKCTPRHLR